MGRMSRTNNISDLELNIRVFEKSFILITSEASSKNDFRSLSRSILQAELDFVDEKIIAENEICLKLNSSFNYQDISKINALALEKKSSNKSWELPVLFKETDDMAIICEKANLTFEQIIEIITSQTLTASMLGFLPGFVYMEGLPEEIQIERKGRPKKNIESGSFAIASKYAGIYNLTSPGGWYVLGSTPCSISNNKTIPPNPIDIGDKIRIVVIDEQQYSEIKSRNLNLVQYNEELRNIK